MWAGGGVGRERFEMLMVAYFREKGVGGGGCYVTTDSRRIDRQPGFFSPPLPPSSPHLPPFCARFDGSQ